MKKYNYGKNNFFQRYSLKDFEGKSIKSQRNIQNVDINGNFFSSFQYQNNQNFQFDFYYNENQKANYNFTSSDNFQNYDLNNTQFEQQYNYLSYSQVNNGEFNNPNEPYEDTSSKNPYYFLNQNNQKGAISTKKISTNNFFNSASPKDLTEEAQNLLNSDKNQYSQDFFQDNQILILTLSKQLISMI